jgi:hypothetical protein
VKVSLYRQLYKENNIIKEIFTINPKKIFLADDSRAVRDFIVLLSFKYSIKNSYKLLSSKTSDYYFERTYEYNPDVIPPPPGLVITFDYIPFVGKHTCKKCTSYIKLKRGGACNGRVKKLKYDIWEGCHYWHENSIIKNLEAPEGKW